METNLQSRREEDPRITASAVGGWSRCVKAERTSRQRVARGCANPPRHVEEFLFVLTICRGYAGFDAQRRIAVEDLLAAAASNVVPLEKAEERGTGAGETRLGTQALVGGGCGRGRRPCGGGWWLTANYASWPRLFDRHRRAAAFELADGSTVQLNTTPLPD